MSGWSPPAGGSGSPSGAAGGDLAGTYPSPTLDLSKAHVWTGEQKAPDLVATGLTGAVAASRYVGATAAVAPASGTFAVGDFAVSQTGHLFVCTVAGTPGTWVDAGSVGNAVASVFGRTGTVAAAASDYTFAQIAAAANAIAVSNLAAGLAGQVLGGTGPGYAYPPGYEFGYDEITSTVNVASTTEATGTTIISCGAHTFDGAPVICEFFSPIVNLPTAAAGNFVIISLFEAAAQISRLVAGQTPSITAQDGVAMYARLRFTPTAAAHTYTVTAFANSVTGTPAVQAGIKGTGAYPPAFVRFTKV